MVPRILQAVRPGPMSSRFRGRLHLGGDCVRVPGRSCLMTTSTTDANAGEAPAVPPVVDQDTWEAALADLRKREKVATRELDAIAAARRRLPMVELPDYTL